MGNALGRTWYGVGALWGFVLIAVAGCGGSDESAAQESRIETLEARVAETDAGATADASIAARATATMVALVDAYAHAVETEMARPTDTPVPPTATPNPAPAPAQPPRSSIPTYPLTGTYEEITRQAGQRFVALTNVTQQLVTAPQASGDWQARLLENMLGYQALALAWGRVSPPACAAGFHSGMALGYKTYGGGAGLVQTAIEQGQSVFSAITFDPDLPPLLRYGRMTPISFAEAAIGGWGVSQQAIDVGGARTFFDSLGFAGLNNVDLGIFGASIRAGGASLASMGRC